MERRISNKQAKVPGGIATWRSMVPEDWIGEETFAPGMALQNQVRELHRLLGKKTLEAEILKTRRASKKQQPT
jgi:hypothetical protein